MSNPDPDSERRLEELVDAAPPLSSAQITTLTGLFSDVVADAQKNAAPDCGPGAAHQFAATKQQADGASISRPGSPRRVAR